jgi:hypothetical protein
VGHIIKVSSENQNIKFFRAGDNVSFTVASLPERDQCKGYVRSVEKGYFVLYVTNFHPCWGKVEYFRRGTILLFASSKLANRVRDAGLYRTVLMRRKRDFFGQLNKVNHFLWTYDQQKVNVAADYDKKIIELEKLKRKAVEGLRLRKKDQVNLQRELMRRLDQIDQDLEHYRISNDELYIDRWHSDHDAGLPMQKRPQEVRATRKSRYDIQAD